MAKTKTILKDFGQIEIPTSWDEMSLQTFSKLQKLMAETENHADITQVISVLSGKDDKEVNELPLSFIESIAARLTYLSVDIPKNDAKNEIELGGEKYFINYENELTFKEYRHVQTVMQNDEYNYAEALAVLCRKKGEKLSDLSDEEFAKRIEMFNAQPITNVLPLIQFFFLLYTLKTKGSEICGDLEQGIQYVTNTSSSQKSGRLSRYFTKLAEKTRQSLRRLTK